MQNLRIDSVGRGEPATIFVNGHKIVAYQSDKIGLLKLPGTDLRTDPA